MRTCLTALLLLALAARGAEPVYPVKSEASAGDTSRIVQFKQRIPLLRNDRGDRWPMIMWEAISYEPQPPEVYEALLARGLTQHIRMDEKMIPTALALQKAGSPVIMMQGAGGTWPYHLAGDQATWAHSYEEGYTPQSERRGKACLGVIAGWQVAADQVRATLRKYKEAGVTVDAVWMDWEGEPLGSSRGYENARHCERCRRLLPRWVLASKENYGTYCWRLYLQLTGTYLGAAVLEVFPKCSTTNWMAVHSTPQRPVLHWNDRALPPSLPFMFTGTNPVAYGNTVFFASCWDDEWPMDRDHVDQFYFNLLIRQVSADAANYLEYAPQVDCFPWVIRWCPDVEDPEIPIMSRERYREVLRHIWLRGADGMQVFNAGRKGYEDLVHDEVADAVIVYDELLAYREFLDAGEIMCTDVPGKQDDGVVWSGLRLPDRALVRAFRQGPGSGTVAVEPWPGKAVTLEVTPAGETYVLHLEADGVRKEKRPSPGAHN